MGWWKRSKVAGGKLGDAYWLDENGRVIELGPVSREDWKLLAFVLQEMHNKQVINKSSKATLARLRALTHRFYERTRVQKNRSE